MRSRIEPMKKIARSLRNHHELTLNYFRAEKMLSSGGVNGLNNKAAFSPYITDLATCPNRSPPTISSDDPFCAQVPPSGPSSYGTIPSSRNNRVAASRVAASPPAAAFCKYGIAAARSPVIARADPKPNCACADSGRNRTHAR